MRDPDEEVMKMANLESITRLQRVIDAGPGTVIDVLEPGTTRIGKERTRTAKVTEEVVAQAKQTIANLMVPFDADYLFQVRHRVRR